MQTQNLNVEGHGSIYLLIAEDNVGETWIEEHIPSDAQRWGGAVVVEHRYIADIVNGARDDGLKVKVW